MVTVWGSGSFGEKVAQVASQVFVVDDDAVARAYAAGVASAAGYAVSQFDSAEAFLAAVAPETRGCVVLDLQMDGMTGLELQAELQRRQMTLPVIIVSGRAEVASAVTAMKLQAFDFFEKPVDPHALKAAICRGIDFDEQQAHRRNEQSEAMTRYASLSPREREVMGLVVQGLPNKQMAARLSLSEKTIEVHRGNVMRKMQVESVAALVRASIVCDLKAQPEKITPTDI
ncbi:MAG TPA: response regulator [Tepidisphaeraceae bacterium]|jgi:FixJ family two-component response regulator